MFGIIKLAESIKVSQKITELRVSVSETIYLLPHEVENMANLLANNHVANLSIFDYKHRLIEQIRLTDGMLIAGRERLNTMSHSTLSDTTASTVKTVSRVEGIVWPDLEHMGGGDSKSILYTLQPRRQIACKKLKSGVHFAFGTSYHQYISVTYPRRITL